MSGSSSGRDPQWERIESLFDAALDQPEEKRAEWLQEACADDPALLAQLTRLLSGHEKQKGILDRPLFVTMATNPLEIIEVVLSRRYRIERELGRGGMAVVYLAHEHKHGRQVVLKAMRPRMAATKDVADRFAREVRIIAKLAHPNLIGLIDSGEAAGLLYYVMPFVEGETLRTKLLREGKLPPGEAVPLLRDIALGLAYIHQHGVVHRDLKPENVLCAGTHALLMDFGIAKILERAPEDGTTTGEWTVVGTPGYMAPEQHLPGQFIDHRADIYSFGLIAREMLTGQRPAVGVPRDGQITGEGAEASVSPALLQLISDCCQPDPRIRPASASELLRRLGPLRSSGAAPSLPEPKRSRRPIWYGTGIGIMALAAYAWFSRETPTRPTLPLPVAVAAFVNQTGDSTLDIWGRMAGDWVTQGLQETGLASVVPWPVASLASQLYSGSRGTLVDHIRKETGAGTVITGSYYLIGDSLQFRVEATDAAMGTVLGAPPPVVVPRDSAVVGIREVRTRLMGTVGIFTNELLSASNDLIQRPPRFDAYIDFDRGLQAARAQNYAVAAAHYAQAYQKDTTFTAALLHEANADWNSREFARLDSVLAKVRPRLHELSEYYRNWFVSLEAMYAGDGMAAMNSARAAAEAGPGSMAWYNFAVLAMQVGRGQEAIAAMEKLNPDLSEMRGWAPYWTQLAHAYHMAGNNERELAAARDLRARHSDRRVGLVLEARALAVLGRLAELDSALVASSTLAPTTYWSQGAAMIVAGEELLSHGRKEEGRRYLARGVNWVRAELAVNPADQNHRYWLGSALYDLNRWSESAAIFERLATEQPARLDYHWLTGLARLRSGADSMEVERWFPVPADWERGEYLVARARVALIRGDREAALSIFADALRYGINGVAWLHGSGVRDFEMLGELRARMPAGILPEE